MKMRILGLKSMIRSYSVGKTAVAYSLRKFAMQLFFENDQEVLIDISKDFLINILYIIILYPISLYYSDSYSNLYILRSGI